MKFTKPSERAIQPLESYTGLSTLSEEAEILFRVIHQHFLSSKWQSLAPLISEICFLLNIKQVPNCGANDLLKLVRNGLHELSESGHIGLYYEDRDFHFRQIKGHLSVSTRGLPDKFNIVGPLVDKLGFDYFKLDHDLYSYFGGVLRRSGIDWESKTQLLELFRATVRIGIIEISRNADGVLHGRLTNKCKLLYQKGTKP